MKICGKAALILLSEPVDHFFDFLQKDFHYFFKVFITYFGAKFVNSVPMDHVTFPLMTCPHAL